MTFKDFIQLKEAGTSTADVAVYTRPIGVMVRRTWGVWSQEDPFDSEEPKILTMKWGIPNEEKPVKKKKKKKK